MTQPDVMDPGAGQAVKHDVYRQTLQAIEALVEGETDPIAVMSTVACELYHAFDYFNWVGFYRRTSPDTLKVGPYQGSHGCLTIDIRRGVCGACARTATVQIENDVSKAAHHIACSSETQAEIVLPVFGQGGEVIAVLDIDSTVANVFDEIDAMYLERICKRVGALSAEEDRAVPVSRKNIP
jgi:GAF domain-containing protein